MSKFKIYLAGAMAGLLPDIANAWRLQANYIFEGYGSYVHTINPCDYYNFSLDPTTYTENEVKEFDLHMVKNCDLVLVNFDFKDSIGTAIEIHMAHDVWQIPVISFGTRENVHPWMKLSSTKHCDTLEDAVEHIVSFYLPNR
jgi:nucleoside 2-deoxyribosyltransferase